MDEHSLSDYDFEDNEAVETRTATDALVSLKDFLNRKKNGGAKLNKVEDMKTEVHAYQMDYPNSPERGYAVIINNENFPMIGMKRRRGTDLDSANLSRLFRKLDFKVEIHEDETAYSILGIAERFGATDHSQYDCFVMVFLSHGDDGVIYGTDGAVEIKTVVDLFRGSACPTLAGKPKIFLFQACRGEEYEDPVESMGDTVDGYFEDSQENEVVLDAAVRPTIPSGSDFLFCYSVAEGFLSLRDTLYGSWYVQAFVEVFEEELTNKDYANAAQMCVCDLLTMVQNKVAMRKVEAPCGPEYLGKKQMPCFLSMLTKKLFLAPKRR